MFGRVLEFLRGGGDVSPFDEHAKVIKLNGVARFRFKLHPPGLDQYISESIREDGVWSPVETDVALRLLPLYGLFLDFGANIGWFTALAREAMPNGGVIHAFEPESRNFALLKANAGSGKRVTLSLVQAAVSDQPGVAQLYHAATNLGDHRLYESDDGRDSDSVAVTSLDSYFGDDRLPPRLVKMDTQGSEAKIFRGAARTLRDGDPASAYMIEFWPWGLERSGEDVEEFIALLERFPQQPLTLDWPNHALHTSSWQDIRRRWRSGELEQEDLLLVTPGSAAYDAVTDLIKAP